ncbi:putative bifunctional diguanylate cyclase/phosphodiesterase [Propylenella binzhouense]|nr:EAL domain-containing protein [Propylenella binzhouense]
MGYRNRAALEPPHNAREDAESVPRQNSAPAIQALARWEIDQTEQNRLFQAVLKNITQGVCMFDDDNRLLVCNDRYAEMYGLLPEHTQPGTPLREILQQRVAAGSSPIGIENYVENRLRAVSLRTEWYAVDELCNGRVIAVWHRSVPGGGSVSTHADITEQRRAEEQVAYMAQHDPLTGLGNRRRFRDEMHAALRQCRLGGQFAVLCLDLDNFKAVNDSLGHPVGDALLMTVAQRLKDRVGEAGAIARIGGDEFAVVHHALQTSVDAERLAQHLIETLNEPIVAEGHRIVVGVSIGIAIAPDDGADPDDLLRNADMALYRAKSDGRGVYRFFEPEMDARAQARRALETDLRLALATGQFELHYQPLLDVRSNAINCVEALVRWRHPQRGMIPPLDFISIAEETGLIIPLGRWVLERACRDASAWRSDLKVAVNVSAMQFRGRDLVRTVKEALAASGLAPERLELEITESVLMRNDEGTLADLRELKALGVRISMDDFGTGYCSLGYLRSFPFDKIKIDHSFIRDIGSQPDCEAIVRSIAWLGTSLGIVTTAEGVETAEQFDQLREMGCTEAQGFLFSPAIPAADVMGFVAGRLWDALSVPMMLPMGVTARA